LLVNIFLFFIIDEDKIDTKSDEIVIDLSYQYFDII